MVYLFGLVVATTSRGTARAFSSSSWVPRHLCSIRYEQYHPSQSLIAQARLYASNEPRTGWMHNSPNQNPAETTASSSQEEPRTGWLHNTAPPKKASSVSGRGTEKSVAQLLLEQAKMQQERNHRILCPPAFHTGGKNQVIVVTEHMISVPLVRNSDTKDARRIDVFFSVVEILKDTDRSWWQSLSGMNPIQRASAYITKAALTTADDILLYLQGGPGFGAPTPVVGLSLTASWASEALTHYSRLILMDQRGTGRSTPITKQRLELDFVDMFLLDEKDTSELPSLDELQDTFPSECNTVKKTVQEATQFMAQFRADSIVIDAEDIKEALLLPFTSDNDSPRPYGCALGQSYGGFCLMTYLSQIAHPPRICLFTGGIAPMLTPVDRVYDATWERVKERSLRYYDAYPGDIAVVKKVVKALLEKPATLPSGSALTARRFLQIGLSLGGSPSSFASLHRMFNTAFLNPQDNDDTTLTRAFLKAMDSEQSFDDHPIYFLLHESIYADGGSSVASSCATNWAAHRAYESRVQRPSEWDYRLTSALNSDARPTLLFGEMVFPWMAHGDFAELSGLGMRSLAQKLAEKADWGPLYNKERMRKALEDGSISRAAAAVYYEDMYVDFDASMLVTKRGAPLEKCKVWVSNEYQHSGLRDNGAGVFTKLHGMALGNIRTPS